MVAARSIALAALGLALLGAPVGADELSGTLEKIRDSGRIVLGHRASSIPFSYLDRNGEPVGYAIDLCLQVVDAVQAELGLERLEVEMVAVDPQTRIPLLVDGTIDLECGSTTRNLSRQELVDFGPIVFITGTKLLVKQESGIDEIEDLEGKAIALASGTTNEAVVKDVAAANRIGVELVTVKDHAEGFSALETGRVDAYATDLVLLYGLISRAQDPDGYAVVGRFLSYEPYALMVRRDDAALRLVVDRTLAALFRTGEIRDIYQKWFGPLGVPTTDLLEAAFALQALPE